jgi:hypothetical protein
MTEKPLPTRNADPTSRIPKSPAIYGDCLSGEQEEPSFVHFFI